MSNQRLLNALFSAFSLGGDAICAILPGQELEIILLALTVASVRCWGMGSLSCVVGMISRHDSMAFGYRLNIAPFWSDNDHVGFGSHGGFAEPLDSRHLPRSGSPAVGLGSLMCKPHSEEEQ